MSLFHDMRDILIRYFCFIITPMLLSANMMPQPRPSYLFYLLSLRHAPRRQRVDYSGHFMVYAITSPLLPAAFLYDIHAAYPRQSQVLPRPLSLVAALLIPLTAKYAEKFLSISEF